MKILYIAPLPPPITGHSLVSKVLFDELMKVHDPVVVNLSKDSFKEGIDGVKRVLQVAGLIKDVWKKKRDAQAIYLTISESLAGNIKDLFIYLICFRNLDKMYIHLHGGSIKRLLWDKFPLLERINKFFIRRLGGVIISGKSHIPIFEFMLPPEKIHIVPNFAEEYIFVSEEDIVRKINADPIRVLYMSNLIPKKGYNELADAYLTLNDTFKSKIQVDFAGKFDTIEAEKEFLKKIADSENMKYHGLVDNEYKRKLFAGAHIFCLPTAYFEGQPISILEAYASGCVVVTTSQSGILDIFEDQYNGFAIEPQSPQSIVDTLIKIVDDKETMLHISLSNLNLAKEKYRTSIYTSSLRKIIENTLRN